MEARLEAKTNRRPHALLDDGSQPYLLERMADIEALWDRLGRIAGITDSRLSAVVSLLTQKLDVWGAGKGNADEVSRAAFGWLADCTVRRDLGGGQDIRAAILDGTLFDVDELYRRILKQSIESVPSGIEKEKEA